jgi:spore coat-associated protein N
MKKVNTRTPTTKRNRVVGALIMGTALIGGIAVVSSSVYASLNANTYNTAAHSVSTNTLKLTMASSAVSGLTGGVTTAITGLAPGDVVNRFLELTNGGTMAASSMTLSLADAASTTLTTNGTAGLQIAIYECSTQWTTVTGACAGTSTTAMASTTALSLTTTPATITLASLAAGTTSHLRVQISLPAGSEMTTNGTLPVGTVQGVTSTLTWTFNELQRTATTTAAS